MTLKELLEQVKDNPELQLEISKLFQHEKRLVYHDNRTFKYMRVKPAGYAKTPMFPMNIWKRCEYFKPKGRGTTGRQS